jgi:hypothetical protein
MVSAVMKKQQIKDGAMFLYHNSIWIYRYNVNTGNLEYYYGRERWYVWQRNVLFTAERLQGSGKMGLRKYFFYEQCVFIRTVHPSL